MLMDRSPQGDKQFAGEIAMFRKLLFAAIAVGLVSVFSLEPAPAEAAGMQGMTCRDAAEAKYPNNLRKRLTWLRLCRANWRLHQG